MSKVSKHVKNFLAIEQAIPLSLVGLWLREQSLSVFAFLWRMSQRTQEATLGCFTDASLLDQQWDPLQPSLPIFDDTETH